MTHPSMVSKQLVAHLPEAQQSMSEGFAQLDKLLADKKSFTEKKKKAMDEAHKKVEEGRL